MIHNDAGGKECATVKDVIGNGFLTRKSQRALRQAQELLTSSSIAETDRLSSLNCGKLVRLILYANSQAAGRTETDLPIEWISLKTGR